MTDVERLRQVATEAREMVYGNEPEARDWAALLDRAADALERLPALEADLDRLRAEVAVCRERLRVLAACRCEEAWTSRGKHAPECHADEGLLDPPDEREIAEATRA